jgi:hypothetical protein
MKGVGSSVSEKTSSRQLGEHRSRLLSGPKRKHLPQKAKIVHLAHVLSFARIHYIAVEPQPAGESGREKEE